MQNNDNKTIQSESHFSASQPFVQNAVVLLCGIVIPFAFAPYNIYPIAVIAPAIVFYIWINDRPKEALWHGLLFGCGMFASGLNWLIASLHDHANLSLFSSLLIYSIIVFLLSIWFALAGWLASRFSSSQKWPALLLFLPSLWVITEIIRTHFLTGFPWLLLGYSQIDTSLALFSPWLGIYGVSYLTAICSSLLVLLFTSKQYKWAFLAGLVTIFTFPVLFLGTTLNQQDKTSINVTLIPGNIPIKQKWQPQYIENILQYYLTRSENAQHTDLIIWPESALPTTLERMPASYMGKLKALASSNKADFVIGAVEMPSTKPQKILYNSAIVIGRQGGTYRKQQLIPFLEFYPLAFGRELIRKYFNIPMSSYQHGLPNQPPIIASGTRIGVSICYELAYPELIRLSSSNAALLINLAEDGWINQPKATAQILQIARMRALETARYLIRVSNNGPSVVINSEGDIIAGNNNDYSQPVQSTVQKNHNQTYYTKLGNLPVYIILLLSLIIFFIIRQHSQHK